MANLRRVCYDNETGEIIPYQINNETGEQLLNNARASRNIIKKKPSRFPHILNRPRKFQDLKDNISPDSNTMIHRMLLLLPTFMIFPSIISVIIIFFEVVLHIRCHNKNKTLKDKNLFYRSPFHVVTRTFCGVCKDHAMVNKIGLLQDKRRYQYDYFKRIAI